MINIVEILKDCPKGTRLYSPICGNCKLLKIYNGLGLDVINDADEVFNFSYDGRYNLNGECCIFPSKDKRDWNTFRPFKDGDIIAKDEFIVIFSHSKHSEVKILEQIVYYHCYLRGSSHFKSTKDCGVGYISDFRFATDEEKQKLFNAIKENGYKWNSETKTLEKIIVPKFKDGDKIKEKNERFPSTRTIYNYVEGIGYFTTIHDWVRIEDQDNWELVPTHKFKVGDTQLLKQFKKKYVKNLNFEPLNRKWDVIDLNYISRNEKSKIDFESVRSLYECGYNVNQICKELNLKDGKVYKIIRKIKEK